MTRETVYVVQAFVAGRGASLKAETAIPCKSAEGAKRTAERLAQTKLGVVAFSSSGDAEMGDYDDEPTVFFRAGDFPPPSSKKRGPFGRNSFANSVNDAVSHMTVKYPQADRFQPRNRLF